jgi:hypothetical protein
MSARQVRRFQLERDVDVSGVSGTGAVAFGAQAPDGTCVLWWASGLESTTIYPSMETLLAIHGHGGLTRAIYIDPDLSGCEQTRPGGDGGGSAGLGDRAVGGADGLPPDDPAASDQDAANADDEPARALTRAAGRATPRAAAHQAAARALRPPSRSS